MIILIVGRIGAGKTFLNDCLSREFARRNPDMPVFASRREGFGRSLLPRQCRTFYRPQDALDAIEGENARDFLFTTSEAQDVIGSETGRNDPRMFDLIFRGRHIGANIICDTQRITLVKVHLLSQCDDILVFRQTAPQDLERVYDHTGDPDSPGVVVALPQYAFLSLHSGQVMRLQA